MKDASPEMLSIFAAAIERPSFEERAAFMEAACGRDHDLRRRIEALLQAHDDAGGFLRDDSPAGAPVPTSDQQPSEGPGTVIGPYKLLEQIGEGGFGVVFLAQQTVPVRRKVALKVNKPGMDTRQVVARFEAERQALAIMDHPNIAKVFDGGITPSGRPYFVMELVKGTPITDFCDEYHLDPRQRLELFADVCRAVQHAHQKGVIHRDLKPSNVLVSRHDSTPVVKVIDFGVAKALAGGLTDKTLFTGVAQMIGTPLYMSPEQAGMSDLDVDTRSDIYSLGILMYELLTGTTPVTKERFQSAAYDEIRRIIREEEPPKPSTRLTSSKGSLATISARRSIEPEKLAKLVRGELDWIVMKALEKDRNRRYDTANAFALDVERYLADEPVLACPPSAGYRLRKFARRNRARLLMASAVSLGVIGVAAAVGWAAWDRRTRDNQLSREKLERAATISVQVRQVLADVERMKRAQNWAEAQSAARRAEAVLVASEALTDERELVRATLKELEFVAQLENARMIQDDHEKYSDFEAMDRAYLEAFAAMGVHVRTMPLAEASRRLRSYRGISPAIVFALDDWAGTSRGRRHPGARRLSELADAVDDDPVRQRIRQAIRDGRPEKLEELTGTLNLSQLPPATSWLLGIAHRDMNQRAKVLQMAQLQYPDDYWINFSLGLSLVESNPARLMEAVPFFQAALAIRPTSRVRGSLGLTLARIDLVDQAEAVLEKGIELHPQHAQLYWVLGYVSQRRNQHEKAVQLHRQAIALNPRMQLAHADLGDSLRQLDRLDEAIVALNNAIELDPKSPRTWGLLGRALKQQGNLSGAEESLRTAIQLNRKLAEWTADLALLLGGQYRHAEAIALLEGVLASQKHELRPDHPDTLHTMNNLAVSYMAVNRHADALKLLEQTLAARKRVLPPDHLDTLHTMNNLAIAYSNLNRHEQAIKLGEETLAARQRVLGPDDPATLKSMNNLADGYRGVNRHADALKLLEQTLAASKRVLPPDHPDTLDGMNNLAVSYTDLNRHEEAVKLHEETLAILKRVLPPDHPRTLDCMQNLSVSYSALNRHEEAVKLDEETLAARQRVLGPDDPATLATMRSLALGYRDVNRHADALELLEQTLAARKRALPPDHPDTLGSMNDLAISYTDLNRHEEAVKLDEETLAARKRVLGPDNLGTLYSMNNVAVGYYALHRAAEALELQEEALASCKRVLPPDHPLTFIIMNNLALSYSFLNRYEEAVELHEETLAARKRMHGPDHRDIPQSLINLANIYMDLNRHADSIPLLEEALAIQQRVLVADHPDMLRCVYRLAVAYAAMNRHAEATVLFDRFLANPDRPTVDPKLIPTAIEQRLRCCQKLGDVEGCRLGAEMQERRNPTDANSLYNAACFRAVAAALQALTPGTDADRLASQDADRAMAWLIQAVAAGWTDADHMKKDADLDALRDREDFQKLLADLEEKREKQ